MLWFQGIDSDISISAVSLWYLYSISTASLQHLLQLNLSYCFSCIIISNITQVRSNLSQAIDRGNELWCRRFKLIISYWSQSWALNHVEDSSLSQVIVCRVEHYIIQAIQAYHKMLIIEISPALLKSIQSCH